MRRSRMVALIGAAALATTALGGTTATAALHTTTTVHGIRDGRRPGPGRTSSSPTAVPTSARSPRRCAGAARRSPRSTPTSGSSRCAPPRPTSCARRGGSRASRPPRTTASSARSPDAGPCRTACSRSTRPPRAGRPGTGRPRRRGRRPTRSTRLLWGMDMINAPQAHAVELGNKKVKVGVMDTGVDGTHPDLAPNFDRELSRNFVTDMPDIDGPCEYASCVDPVDEDDDGHGTHTAGTMAAALNGIGMSGVAPGRHARQRPRRPGQRLLLPQRHGQRADLLRQRRPRRRQHVVLRRPVALQLQGRRPGGHPGAGGRAGRHHRDDEPGARLRAPQGRHARGGPGQQPRGHLQPAHRHHEPRLPGRHRAPCARSTTRTASTSRSRARTSSVSRRSARRSRRPTTPTGPPTSPPVSSRSRPRVAGSATASALPPTAPTAT